MPRFAAPALAAALLLATPAGADTLTDCFDPVSAEVDARVALLPVVPVTKAEKAEKKALLAVRKVLDKEYRTLTVAVDVKNAARIAKTLVKAYPADGEIDGLLDDLFDCLMGHCQADHGALQPLILELPDGKKKDSLVAAHDALDTRLDVVFSSALPTTDRLRALGPVAKGLVALRKKYDKTVAGFSGKPGITAVVDGRSVSFSEVEGNIVLDPADSSVTIVSFSGTRLSGNPLTMEMVTVTLAGLVGFVDVEPGTYDISTVPVAFGYGRSGGTAPPVILAATAGTLTLVKVDAATGSVAGSFDCTALDGEGHTVTLKAKFNLTGLPVDDGTE